MPPPPKPPVICYDLQTNANARRTPCSRYRVSTMGTALKSRVTVIPTEESELRTDSCWHHTYEHEADDEYENSRKVPTRRREKLHDTDNEEHHLRQQQSSNHQTVYSDYQMRHKTSSWGSSLNCTTVAKTKRQQQVRYEYDQKLKERLRQKERLEERRRHEVALKAELDAITLKLESVKKLHENLEHTYGMSHNAARYFQKKDEDYANLKRKLDQFAQIRSRDAEKQLQQKKQLYKLQQQEDRDVELRRLRDMPRLAHKKHKLTSTLNGSLPPSPQTPSSSGISTRNSPSSTVSISSRSSPLSSTEELPQHNLSHHNSHSIARATLSNKYPVSSSTPTTSKQNNRRHSSVLKTQPKRPYIDFSFYKGPPQGDRETLEVTDINFLEKVEDKTMLEVNELLNKMQSVLGDSFNEQRLYNEIGDTSKLRSQVDNLAIQTPDIADYCNQSYF